MNSKRALAIAATVLVSVGASFVAGAAGAASPPADPIRFTVDPVHSSIGFSVRHMGISKVRGEFDEWEASFVFDPDDPSASSVRVTIDAASIDTGVERRDNHLRSADFLEVESHPQITFESTEVRRVGDGEFEVEGDLTIHGVTRTVILDAELGGMLESNGRYISAFSAETTINRKDYGLTWNRVLEAGNLLVGEEVTITIEIEAQQADEA